MAKSEFDARVIARNTRTNKIIDDVKRQSPTTVDRHMVDRVLRSYMHILNECEIHDVDPEQIYDATTSVLASAYCEVLVRTIPKGNTSMLHGTVQTVLDEFRDAFLKAVAVNFDVQFETDAPPAPTQAGPLAH